MSTSSSDDKCIGARCRGIVVFTPQLRDLISGPNPDIVQAAGRLVACPKCKSLASDLKEKTVTVLALHGINTLPKKGIDAIKFDPKCVRYKIDTTDEDRRYGWQYRCGSDSFDWYNECTNPRCMGVGKIEQSDLAELFEKLYRAVRAPEGSGIADLKSVFEMCHPCGYGHPAASGEVQTAEMIKEFVISIAKACKYGTSCNNATGSCSMYHGNAEKKKLRDRLESYVASIRKRVTPQTSWGNNAAPLVVASPTVLLSPGGTTATVVQAPASAVGGWAVPKLQVAVAPAPVVVAAPAPAQIVVKAPAEDFTISTMDVHTKYVNDMKNRVTHYKADNAELEKEIKRMNKIIEANRAKIAYNAGEIEATTDLISMISIAALAKKSASNKAAVVAPVKIEAEKSESKPVVEKVEPVKVEAKKSSKATEKVADDEKVEPVKVEAKKPVIRSLQSMPVLESAPVEEPLVDVTLASDDALAGPLVFLPAVNADTN